jgi:hypothetical protein
MKSLTPILLLLISLLISNSKSDDSVVQAQAIDSEMPYLIQRETKKELRENSDIWDQEPTSIFGVPFGTPKTEVAKRFRLSGCSKSTVMEICHFAYKLSEVNLRCTVAFSSKNGMQHVRANFPENDHKIVLSALLKVYGPPHFTLADAEDSAKTWGQDWRGKNVDVSLMRESFSITTKLFHKEIEESKKRQINSAANEL